jgi:hypothetical protein
MDTTACRAAKSHLECGETEFGVDALGNSPTDNFAGVEIQNRRQINEAGTNPNVSDVGNPDLVHSTYLTVLEQVPIDRQRVVGIGGPDEPAPEDWAQTEYFHNAPNTFGIGGKPAPLELALDATVAIAGEFLLNAFDLLTKLLILVNTSSPMFGIGLVIEAAGGQPAYLAGFRNRSKFFEVITDVSALLFC